VENGKEREMDLKGYFQKIRDVEAKIDAVFPVVVSLATPDGGAAGVLTEVTRALAAKMVAEGLVKLASTEQAKVFRETTDKAKRVAEEVAAAAKLTFSVISSAEQRLHALGQAGKKSE
jgi:hypothetical protein